MIHIAKMQRMLISRKLKLSRPWLLLNIEYLNIPNYRGDKSSAHIKQASINAGT